jgi:hypothetical protein
VKVSASECVRKRSVVHQYLTTQSNKQDINGHIMMMKMMTTKMISMMMMMMIVEDVGRWRLCWMMMDGGCWR